METVFKLTACLAVTLAVCAHGLLAGAQTQAPAKAPEDCGELAEVKARLEAQEKRLKDWPDLAHYRDANATMAALAKDEQRVVFMGDSITDMWVLPQFGGFFPGKPYLGRGIGGQTTPQMLLRFRADVIALRPKVVVILAGTNDIAGNTGPITLEETEGNLASMAELARANGIRVVLCSILPVYDYPWRPGLQPAPKIMAINSWLKDYAAAHGDVYADYHSAMQDARHGLPANLA